jgi:hypothetical protein
MNLKACELKPVSGTITEYACSRFSIPYLFPGSPKYKAGVQPTRLQRSLSHLLGIQIYYISVHKSIETEIIFFALFKYLLTYSLAL